MIKFKNWKPEMKDIETDNNINTDDYEKDIAEDTSRNISDKTIDEEIRNERVNTIRKGSKLKGDINITCDLELSGDVVGNITSENNSNIVIKGICKGNIRTKEGSVDIEGEMQSGNISAGSNVTISGKFRGGEIKAKGKICIKGEFNGKLEGNEIEIGANAHGKGELYYEEFISISKGAKIVGQISQTQKELKVVKNSPEETGVDIKPHVQELIEVK